MMKAMTLAAALCLLPACGKKSETAEPASPGGPAAAASAAEVAADAGAAAEAPKQGVSGMHRENASWVPAEYKSGRGRWRDAGVYVDGEPLGMLWFGELPYALEPVWKESVEALDFKPGDTGPRERTIRERRYRIADYLQALGVNIDRVVAVHLHGGIGRVAMIAGDEFRRMRDGLQISFGTGTYGKAIIHFPTGLKTNTTFDRLSGVMVYIDKVPPRKNEDGELELGGNPIYGVPYFGEPMRGGVRIYKDDRMVAYVKRRKLQESAAGAIKDADGNERWKLLQFLQAEGVDTADIAIADVVYDERRRRRYDRAALQELTFMANPQASGQILLGEDNTPATSLALHTKVLPPKVIPDDVD